MNCPECKQATTRIKAREDWQLPLPKSEQGTWLCDTCGATWDGYVWLAGYEAAREQAALVASKSGHFRMVAEIAAAIRALTPEVPHAR